MPDFQFYFELIGAVAFAVSGAALAVKKGMDLFGVAVMGPVQFQARNRLQDRPMKLKNLQKVARTPADFYDF